MSPLEAVVLILLVLLPFHCLVEWQFARMDDPARLRNEGIVIVDESILEFRAQPIGTYMGRPIWASVTFLGMAYCFDRVTRPQHKERTGPGELYLDPGLVYVAT